jgi:hypothetical protein
MRAGLVERAVAPEATARLQLPVAFDFGCELNLLLLVAVAG